jgi:hypothetical protein
LRGAVLEYLESVLPQMVRVVLWPYLDTERTSRGAAPRAAPERDLALRNLLNSSQSNQPPVETTSKRCTSDIGAGTRSTRRERRAMPVEAPQAACFDSDGRNLPGTGREGAGRLGSARMRVSIPL